MVVPIRNCSLFRREDGRWASSKYRGLLLGVLLSCTVHTSITTEVGGPAGWAIRLVGCYRVLRRQRGRADWLSAMDKRRGHRSSVKRQKIMAGYRQHGSPELLPTRQISEKLTVPSLGKLVLPDVVFLLSDRPCFLSRKTKSRRVGGGKDPAVKSPMHHLSDVRCICPGAHLLVSGPSSDQCNVFLFSFDGLLHTRRHTGKHSWAQTTGGWALFAYSRP